MKCLLKYHALKSQPPPQARSPRIPGAFMADHIIVGRYPRYSDGPKWENMSQPRRLAIEATIRL